MKGICIHGIDVSFSVCNNCEHDGFKPAPTPEQISKEAMEKSLEVTRTITNEVRCEGVGLGILLNSFTFAMAREFTNYQKRVEELEKELKLKEIVRQHLENRLHLAKGVKEEG
jgi:hypothetical protein